MAKDDNICPFILGGKFASFEMQLDSEDNQVAAVAPTSANCRQNRCELWDGSHSRCLFKSLAIAAVAYYEANTP
jgi:hypothetical protein